jgi:hypothetical protein
MHLVEQLSEQLLTAIENGDAPFKYIPEEIGALKFCYTDNTRAEPYSKEVKCKKLIYWIGGTLIVPALCWCLFNNSPVINSIVSVIALIVIIKTIKNVTQFEGADYFVGQDGFAELHFYRSRDNIYSKSIHLYDDFSELITGETIKKRNFSYVGTDYFFCFFSKPGNDNQVSLILEESGEHHQEKSTDDPHSPHYSYWKKIEEIWTMRKLKELFLQKDEKVVFSILYTGNDDNHWYATPYITISQDAIIVGGREYNRDTLKNLWFENGNLVIEHVNHSTKLFGLLEKGNIERIPLTNVGNRKLFLMYLSSIIKL